MSKKELIERWNNQDILPIRDQTIRNLYGGMFKPDEVAPFGQLEGRWDYRGFPLNIAYEAGIKYGERITGTDFENIDFT